MGAEQLLGWELVHALGGATPKSYKPTAEWKKGGGIVGASAYRSGEGSCNIPKLRHAIRLLHGISTGAEFWRRAFPLELDEFMVSETGSYIYRSWHLLATAAVMRSQDAELARAARLWCAYYFAVCRLLEVDGQVLWPGQRSAGHLPRPGIHEWIHALASGGDTTRAERWCRAAKVGLRQSWEYAAARELTHELQNAYQTYDKKDPSALAAERGWRRPLHILRYADGSVAAWIEPDPVTGWSNCNGNTPPVPAVVCLVDGAPKWLPSNGGERKQRVRQQFDHCRVVRDADHLVYTSDIYGDGSLTLPSSPVLVDVTLGKRT